MTQPAEFRVSRKEIIGFCLLAIRVYEDGGQVEPDTPGDFERRALTRTLGAMWPALTSDLRSDIIVDIREELGEAAHEALLVAVDDLQARARIEREIGELDQPPKDPE